MLTSHWYMFVAWKVWLTLPLLRHCSYYQHCCAATAGVAHGMLQLLAHLLLKPATSGRGKPWLCLQTCLTLC